VANLDCVADGAAAALVAQGELGEGAGFEAVVVLAGEVGGLRSGARQKVEEGLEAGSVEGKLWRELPEHGAELRPQREHTGGEEVGQGLLHVAQLQHVGDVAAALDGEDEILGRLLDPVEEAGGALQRVEGAVDLDRREERCGVGQLSLLRQRGRVEPATPALVVPAGDADANAAGRGGCGHEELDAGFLGFCYAASTLASTMRGTVYWPSQVRE
jgi:hypothetical protein